jgi:hypothetical protein
MSLSLTNHVSLQILASALAAGDHFEGGGPATSMGREYFVSSKIVLV